MRRDDMRDRSIFDPSIGLGTLDGGALSGEDDRIVTELWICCLCCSERGEDGEVLRKPLCHTNPSRPLRLRAIRPFDKGGGLTFGSGVFFLGYYLCDIVTESERDGSGVGCVVFVDESVEEVEGRGLHELADEGGITEGDGCVTIEFGSSDRFAEAEVVSTFIDQQVTRFRPTRE